MITYMYFLNLIFAISVACVFHTICAVFGKRVMEVSARIEVSCCIIFIVMWAIYAAGLW